MEPFVNVLVDASRYPGRARAAYVESFRSRQMDHQFHYDTEKQAQHWLAIHEAYSPARRDPDCLQTYLSAFDEISARLPAEGIALVSLGCGGGQKDTALAIALSSKSNGYVRRYIPADVSLTLALTAHFAVTNELHLISSRPALLDLPRCPDLGNFLEPLVPSEAKVLIAFFGMLPNFEPEEAFRPLAELMRPDDHLVLSANLAPGPAYREGVQKVLPLYDNEPTRRWLATVLIDAGLDVNPDHIIFRIREVPMSPALLRIEAIYKIRKQQSIRLDGEEIVFQPGESFRLFFSYRHTPRILRELLANFGIEIIEQWIAASEEEGVFYCRKIVT